MVAPVQQQAPPAPPPNTGQPPGPPGGALGGQIAPQVKQALLQFFEQLRANPQTRPLAETLLLVARADPSMLRQIGGLLLDQGPQVVVELLATMTQKRLAQGGGGQPQPQPAPGRVEVGPPAGAPPQVGPPAGPPPGGVVPPQNPANAPGQADTEGLHELLAELPPDLARVVRGLRPDQQGQLVGLLRQRGMGAVEALLRQYVAARGGTSPQSQAPARKADQPDMPGAQPKKKKRSKSTPAFELRPLPPNRWGDKGPGYATCVRHLQEAREIWKPRDLRIQEDVRLYNQSRVGAEGIPMGPRPGKPYNAAGGDIVHISSRPFAFVERVTAYCTASGDRRPDIDCPPWSDDDDTVNASQALEDWLLYRREMDESEWMRRGASGDPRMPLPRIEAGGMALLGGAGFRTIYDPEDKQHPLGFEYIPLNRLYPYPGVSMIYAEQMTLAEARVAIPEINEYYPPEDADTCPPANMQIHIGSWTDVYEKGQGGLWHGIFWYTGGDAAWGDRGEDSRAKWIKKPTRIDYGFSPYQMVIWGGAPYYATQEVGDYERFRGMGCLTALRRAFKLFDLLQSAIATQAVKLVDPAVMQYYLPGTRKEEMKRVSTLPGATNYGIVGEKVEPLVWSVAGSPDGTAILQSIWQEISSLDSPLLGGGSNANSGFQQTIQQGAASAVQVNPIMDALEQYYQLQNTCAIELLIRKGAEGELAKLPYPSRPVDDQFDTIYPTFKALTPDAAKLNGTRNTVTFQRLDLMQKQVLWNMLGQAVSVKLLDAREAMKQMGAKNPQRRFLRILQEAAVMNPKALEAMMGAAIMGGQNALFQIGWQQVLQAQAQAPPQDAGPGGGPRGIPSAIGPSAPSGGPQGGPPAAMVGQQAGMG